MSWIESAQAELNKPLRSSFVKEREASGGVRLSYIEGHHAIREANRIFGHFTWSRETIEMRQTFEGKTSKGKPVVGYLSKVRVTLAPPGASPIIREGWGSGTGYGSTLAEAHESAAKEAETDAMKRALMTFGDPLGLALYSKDQENVTDEPPTPTQRQVPKVHEQGTGSSKALFVGATREWSQLAGKELFSLCERIARLNGLDLKIATDGDYLKLVAWVNRAMYDGAHWSDVAGIKEAA